MEWDRKSDSVYVFETGAVTAFFSTRLDAAFLDRLAARRPVVLLQQVHSDRIFDLDAEDPGRGDGMVTSRSGVLLGVNVADCLPVFFYSDEQIGIVHAGWRGTAQGISRKMLARFRRPPAFFFGPCIGPCCYAVEEARYDRLHDSFPAAVFMRRDDKIYMDLRAANRYLLKGARELAALDLCTCCHPELFHSYRRDGDKAGRNYAVIGRIQSSGVL